MSKLKASVILTIAIATGAYIGVFLQPLANIHELEIGTGLILFALIFFLLVSLLASILWSDHIYEPTGVWSATALCLLVMSIVPDLGTLLCCLLIAGAIVSRVGKYDFLDGNGLVAAKRHINPDGSIGGWVAGTAHVDPDSYICKNSKIFENAQIRGQVHVFYSTISGDITINDGPRTIAFKILPE